MTIRIHRSEQSAVEQMRRLSHSIGGHFVIKTRTFAGIGQRWVVFRKAGKRLIPCA